MFRKIIKRSALACAITAAVLIAAPASAQTDKAPIVWGASQPMTGVFAFAGIKINAGLTDYIEWRNNHGGINGHPIEYAMQDTGYDVARSVAAFKQITSQHDQVPVYYGDSTGFMKAITAELNAMGSTVMSGASFATVLTDTEAHPYQFIAGPSYSQMIAILLEYIDRQDGDPTVAFVHSTTAFGKDPIANSVARAKELGIEVVENIATKPGSVNVSGAVLKLRRANPDYVIFHGYVLAPINQFMEQLRQMGMDTHFMGTFWSSTDLIIQKLGEAANGYMAVAPYSYFDSGATGPMLNAAREMVKKNQDKDFNASLAYLQGWFNGMVWAKIIEDTLDAGKPLTADNLMTALESIENWDTGGIMGTVSVKNHSFPVGRIYQVQDGQFAPVSDWIQLD